jgi:metallophosphoesterase superfamily enzyme
VILGDFVHAMASHQPELFETMSRWRKANARIEMLLVRGNHDRASGRLVHELNIEEAEEPFEVGGISLCHKPRYDLPRPVLAGHVHPVFTLRDFDRSMVRVPCFVLDGDCCGILPSFGSFTGGHPVHRRNGRRVFLVSGSSVVAIRSK